jgi:T-complex protein 1 subunit eta
MRAHAGARVQTTVNNLDKAVLGTCGRFEERQVRVCQG